jgi:guanylate kinase
MSSENLAAVPIVLSGPSGVGKTTIRQQLLSRYQDIAVSISATTRPKRPGEEHGKDYLFMSQEGFKQGIDAGSFLEWAEVHGEYYGTPIGPVEELLATGTDVLLVIDIQGGVQVKQIYPEALLVFLLPPTMEELVRRMMKRGSEGEETARLRLENAKGELGFAQFYDYWVINHSLDDAVAKVRSIIVADRCRAPRAADRFSNLGYTWPGIDLDGSDSTA